MTETRTYTSTRISSTHGTRKAAQAQAERLARWGGSATITVEHTGPRLFVVLVSTTHTSEPRPVRCIMSGQPFTCACGSTHFFYVGRDRFNETHECAAPGCTRTIHPLTETGAST